MWNLRQKILVSLFKWITVKFRSTLEWRHNGREGVSNHQRLDCLLNRLFGHRSKKTSKLRVTGLCEGDPPVTSEFPLQRTSNAENVSIWWRHNEITQHCCRCIAWYSKRPHGFIGFLAERFIKLCSMSKRWNCMLNSSCRFKFDMLFCSTAADVSFKFQGNIKFQHQNITTSRFNTGSAGTYKSAHLVNKDPNVSYLGITFILLHHTCHPVW